MQGRVHCEVGKVRVRGTTITKDEEEGVAWLRSAAVGGDGRHRRAQTFARETQIHRRAHCTLPLLVSVTLRHAAPACVWWEQTAEAQFELGRCHDEGRGVEQDVLAAGVLHAPFLQRTRAVLTAMPWSAHRMFSVVSQEI
jgi:TPR repeat protein